MPGPSDRRALGVQVDDITCRPTERRRVTAAPGAGRRGNNRRGLLRRGVCPAGRPAVALRCWQPPTLGSRSGIGAGDGAGVLHAVSRSRAGPGARGCHRLLQCSWRGRLRWRMRRLRQFGHADRRWPTRAAALYLLLLALLHPSKTVGRRRVPRPPARRRCVPATISSRSPCRTAWRSLTRLRCTSSRSPWMAVMRDHVALLRIVVCTAHVLTGLLLYAAVVGRWQDRLTGVLAVVLWSLVPQWFVVVGNANLTGGVRPVGRCCHTVCRGNSGARAARLPAGGWRCSQSPRSPSSRTSARSRRCWAQCLRWPWRIGCWVGPSFARRRGGSGAWQLPRRYSR